VDDVFDVPHVLPSKLYCLVKPVTSVNAGIVKAALHVLLTTGADGFAGKITALPVADAAHAAGADVPAILLPQGLLNTYLVFML